MSTCLAISPDALFAGIQWDPPCTLPSPDRGWRGSVGLHGRGGRGKNMDMIGLRSAVDSDATVVARIYLDSWNDGFGHLLGVRSSTPDLVARWRNDLTDKHVDWIIAESEGKIVGFVGVRASRDPVDPDLGEIDTIAVDPPAWRRGVGRALMDEALVRLEREFTAAILWTVAGYERGLRFYQATGWTPLGRTRAGGAEVAFGRSFPGP